MSAANVERTHILIEWGESGANSPTPLQRVKRAEDEFNLTFSDTSLPFIYWCANARPGFERVYAQRPPRFRLSRQVGFDPAPLHPSQVLDGQRCTCTHKPPPIP